MTHFFLSKKRERMTHFYICSLCIWYRRVDSLVFFIKGGNQCEIRNEGEAEETLARKKKKKGRRRKGNIVIRGRHSVGKSTYLATLGVDRKGGMRKTAKPKSCLPPPHSLPPFVLLSLSLICVLFLSHSFITPDLGFDTTHTH